MKNNQTIKALLLIVGDGLLAALALAAAVLLFDEIPLNFIAILGAYAGIMAVTSFLFRLHSTIWRFASLADWVKAVAVCVVSSVGLFMLTRAMGSTMDYGTYVQCACILVVLEIVYRLLLRAYSHARNGRKDSDVVLTGNVMLIGAGAAGSLLLHDIMHNRHFKDCKVVCAIDDDPEKYHHYICGVRVEGNRNAIVSCAKKFAIDEIVFAIPACSAHDRAEILGLCQKTECRVHTLPGVHQLLDQPLSANSIREVQIEDLLGRDPIDIHVDTVMQYVEGETVLVTGGGGSIGSELCRQIAGHRPKQLIIFDIYENNAYDIQNELKWIYPDLDIRTLIGSVRDTERLQHLFEMYQPTLVFHAAAHKHVPLMEDSPNEAIKNNVFGTLKTVQAADKHGVKKFVLISTDKAVNPTNIKGASKRICEMIVQANARRSKTECVAVRFGNVLGSNGSVIPLFEKQIKNGGPVTVTDPNIIRYFMTIPEAVSLVLQAGANAKGGEIFVLDMGEPVRIADLAENMIRLSGLKPYEDIPIVFTGLRPGEKLYEELLMSEEGLRKTDNKLIYIGSALEFDEDELFDTLEQMRACMYDDAADVRKMVRSIVPTYTYKK